MKGTAKRKVVTSGRLTGGVKGQPARRRVTPNAAAVSEPAFSLYSTDSEDQVTTLHKGLDRCAALLSGILQAERAEAKPRSSVFLGMKISKKPPAAPPPNQKSSRSTRSYPGLKPIRQSSPSKPDSPFLASLHHGPKTAVQSTDAASRPGPTLHVSPTPPQSGSQHVSPSIPPSQHSHHRPMFQSSTCPGRRPTPKTERQSNLKTPQADCKAEAMTRKPLPVEDHRNREREDDKCVPWRDIDTQNASDRQVHSTSTYADQQACATVTPTQSDLQLQDGHVDEVLQGAHGDLGPGLRGCGTETDVKLKTVLNLSGEVKALNTGQGSAAEQMPTSSPLNISGADVYTEMELLPHGHNTHIPRRILNLQLRERAERRQNTETHGSAEGKACVCLHLH
ncbi:hypothetical protein LDENG_00171520, partial [Lucifuga dentata]